MRNLEFVTAAPCGRAWLSAVLIATIVTGGCSTMLPEHWSNAKEAFPGTQAMVPPADKPGAFEQATFSTTFEDTYRAASVSASQAMLDVTDEDKSAGYILAEQIPQGKPGVHYYYAIKIDELGAKKSRVTIMSKAQFQCEVFGAGMDIATLGLMPAAQHATGETNDKCRENSEVHWSGDPGQIKQFMSFVRNNLIAAGVL